MLEGEPFLGIAVPAYQPGCVELAHDLFGLQLNIPPANDALDIRRILAARLLDENGVAQPLDFRVVEKRKVIVAVLEYGLQDVFLRGHISRL